MQRNGCNRTHKKRAKFGEYLRNNNVKLIDTYDEVLFKAGKQDLLKTLVWESRNAKEKQRSC